VIGFSNLPGFVADARGCCRGAGGVIEGTAIVVAHLHEAKSPFPRRREDLVPAAFDWNVRLLRRRMA